jgi:hypothetical protein
MNGLAHEIPVRTSPGPVLELPPRSASPPSRSEVHSRSHFGIPTDAQALLPNWLATQWLARISSLSSRPDGFFGSVPGERENWAVVRVTVVGCLGFDVVGSDDLEPLRTERTDQSCEHGAVGFDDGE